MIQTKLVTRASIAEYKQISKTVFDDKLNELIIESQFQDVMPLLGELLFNDVMTNTANYTDLLEGGTYEYNGITYHNYGLQAVIAYYVYARYAMFGNVTDTPFGQVTKLVGESQTTDYAYKKQAYQMNRDSAYQMWRSVENYLIRTENELFGNCHTLTRKTRFNIKKIQ